MAGLGAVALPGHVDPVNAAVGGLLDDLVVVAVVHDPGEPPVGYVGVDETLALLAREIIKGDADVAGFAKGVLGGIDEFAEGFRRCPQYPNEKLKPKIIQSIQSVVNSPLDACSKTEPSLSLFVS